MGCAWEHRGTPVRGCRPSCMGSRSVRIVRAYASGRYAARRRRIAGAVVNPDVDNSDLLRSGQKVVRAGESAILIPIYNPPIYNPLREPSFRYRLGVIDELARDTLNRYLGRTPVCSHSAA